MASMLLLLNSPSYWSPTVAPALRSRPALVSRSAPAAVSMAFALPGFGGKKQAGPSEEARASEYWDEASWATPLSVNSAMLT